MKTILFSFLSVFLIFACANTTTMHIVYPIEMNVQGNYIENQNPPADFYNNLSFVLTHYEIPFKIENEKVRVSSKIYSNKEELSNFTKKAIDKKWLLSKRKK